MNDLPNKTGVSLVTSKSKRKFKLLFYMFIILCFLVFCGWIIIFKFGIIDTEILKGGAGKSETVQEIPLTKVFTVSGTVLKEPFLEGNALIIPLKTDAGIDLQVKFLVNAPGLWWNESDLKNEARFRKFKNYPENCVEMCPIGYQEGFFEAGDRLKIYWKFNEYEDTSKYSDVKNLENGFVWKIEGSIK